MRNNGLLVRICALLIGLLTLTAMAGCPENTGQSGGTSQGGSSSGGTSGGSSGGGY